MPTTLAVPEAAYEVDFRAGGRGHAHLIAGWSHPEPDYTWTLGHESLLHFPPRPAPRDHALRLRAGPLLREGLIDFQRLSVEVNEAVIARLILRAPAELELFVPAAALAGERIAVALRMPDARAPSALGGSGDRRVLGVWLAHLSLRPLAGAAPPPAASADEAILMDLQSLGENCELGFVQRAGGAEPFGLFRWMAAPLPNLLHGLDQRFAGLGSPDDISIELDAASEFQVIDRRYGFRSHSFAFANAGATAEDVLRRELARLPFLTRLLLEALEQGSKLFCFHDAGQSGRAEIDRLVAAIGRRGPNWLLWIDRAERPDQVGTAQRIGERLIRGAIDVFQPRDHVRAPSVAAWMGAIRAAHAIWQAER